MTAKKPAKKVGRPTVFTKEVIGKIEEAAALDASIEEMAMYAGINKDTLYSKLQDDEQFSQRIEELRLRPILAIRQTVVAHAKLSYANGMDYLARKRKKEFSLRTELTGAEGDPITFEVVTYAKDTNTPSLPAPKVPTRPTKGA